VLSGSPGEVEIVEHGVRYRVDPLLGQKTGLFLDQRENRRVVRAYCPGARVLDCFCNDGGFALNAAAAGASSVLGIDISPEAVAHARTNAALNGLAATFQEGDVFDRLRTLRDEGGQYDVIVLDPPSFTRNRKSVPVARKGYRQLHALAFPLLAPGGVLLTASCSHHITAETFLDDVRKSAARAGKALQLLEWHGAAPDHPVLPGVPETEYLKCGLFRAFPAD
jgi:23S rRNA (cytosine1962-C5)-methyltransferase